MPRSHLSAAFASVPSVGSCEGCELFRDATQTVFGLGSAASEVLLVGEVQRIVRRPTLGFVEEDLRVVADYSQHAY